MPQSLCAENCSGGFAVCRDRPIRVSGLRRRFGVGVTIAIRRRQMALTRGRAVAEKPGCDRRYTNTEAHADLIMENAIFL